MRKTQIWLRLFAVVVVSIIFIWLFRDGNASRASDYAEKGRLDLSDWSFTTDGIVKLNGEWEFYWDQLLNPQQLHGGAAAPSYIKLPASWNTGAGAGVYPAKGYATYRLSIRWKDAPAMLALRTKSVDTSYRLWIDGVLQGGMGKVGTSSPEAVPQDAPRIYWFPAAKEGVEIVIQVANFEHRRGGLWEALELGTPQQLQDRRERQLAFDLVLFGSLFTMGLYHFGLFALRRKDRASLFFGAFCLTVALRMLLIGEIYFDQLLPAVSWTCRLKLEYLLTYAALAAFLWFARHLYPHDTSRLVTRFGTAVCLVYAVIALAAPVAIEAETISSFQLVIVAAGGYLLATIIRAALRGRNGAIIAAIGGLLYLISVFNEILYFDQFIKTGSYSPFGLFVFIALYSTVLSMKFTKALTAEEKLSQQLSAKAKEVQELNAQLRLLNRDLEATVAERTQELRHSNESLLQRAAEIARLDDARRQLLSNISHELRTPMTSIRGYAEALLDNVFVKPEEQRHYLQLILNKMIGLNRLITDLFELSKLESGQPDLQFRSVPLRHFLERTRHKYELDVIRQGLTFEWSDGELALLPAETSIVMDPERIDQVLTNLVANAVRCTQAGGRIRLRFAADISVRGGEVVKELSVLVEDTGTGISERDLPFLFERFYRGQPATAGGTGLGLAIAKEIVTHHGGRIWVQSKEGQGSTFGFTLLIYEEALEGNAS